MIITKGYPLIFSDKDQTIIYKAGGNSLSSYAQAIVLIDKSGPSIELIANPITCQEQASNKLIEYRIKIIPGTLIVSNLNIEISFEASETTVYESTPSGVIFEKPYLETAKKLLVAPKVRVKVEGRDNNNMPIKLVRDLYLTFEAGCDVESITCTSNSSQAIMEFSSISPPYRVQIDNSDNKQFNTLQELVAYLNENNIVVNFYQKVGI
jgi:hypothetical protein